MDVKKNPEKLSTIKVNEHIPSGFSMYTIPLLKRMENSLDLYIVLKSIVNCLESTQGR